MRFRIALALSISVVFIGVATWLRLSEIKPEIPTIFSVNQPNTEADGLEMILNNLTERTPTISGAASTSEIVTSTDIVTRNLLLNYIDASVNGDGVVSATTLEEVANHQTDEIINFHVFQRVGIQDIQIISDNADNAKDYANKFSKIYSKYTWEMNLVTDNAESLASLYENISTDLKRLPVPISVSNLHLELVNNQASTAAAVRSMGGINTDPIKAIAGMAALKENIPREKFILAEIDRILRDKYAKM
jgi:hypothetical protein